MEGARHPGCPRSEVSQTRTSLPASVANHSTASPTYQKQTLCFESPNLSNFQKNPLKWGEMQLGLDLENFRPLCENVWLQAFKPKYLVLQTRWFPFFFWLLFLVCVINGTDINSNNRTKSTLTLLMASLNIY